MPPIRHLPSSYSSHLDLVRAGVIGPGKKGSATHIDWRMDLSKEISQTPLKEPGCLLKVDLKDPFIRKARNPISRTIRVPANITFNHLNGILVRALGWNSRNRERMIWGSDKEYRFILWDEAWESGGKSCIREPREILVADHADGEINWKSSKTRRLAQVFGGSRIWPEVPHKIQYEMRFGEDAPCWEYDIEFLGETDLSLEVRPGQEAFCVKGTDNPQESDLGDEIDVAELDLRRDKFDLEYINDRLEGWCDKWRMSNTNLHAR